jgi:2-oxo-3-hexenedioate decarboxylase
VNPTLTTWAKRLDQAAMDVQPVAQIEESLTLEEAYEVQAASLARRLERGERRSGMKMGFTSRAKMVQMGVHDMIWGRLTDSMGQIDGGLVSLKRFIHPRVEPELAFLLRKPLVGPVSLPEALDAVAAIAPAMELIDSRYLNFKFSLVDVIADNASSSGYVIGPWHEPSIEFANLGLVLSFDGRERQIGTTAAILGHPLRSLAAAARLCAQAGDPLQAGWIVLAGGATAAEALEPGRHVSLEMQHLGRVEFTTQA